MSRPEIGYATRKNDEFETMRLCGKVVSRSLLFAIIFLIVGTAVREARAVEPALTDVVIRRDGTRETGTLQACIGERCRWDGRSVARAEIAWIAFAEPPTPTPPSPPSPVDPLRDQVWLRDGRTAVGEILGLSLGSVATETDSYDRPEVAWTYFGSPEGLPRPQAATSADIPAPPPATTHPPPPATHADVAEASVAQSPVPPAPAAPALRLNEVLFLPREDQAPFVEILNAGTAGTSLDGVALRNEQGASFAIPKGRRLAAGAFLVVRFDGAKSAEADVVHAAAGDLLGRPLGAIQLSDRQGTVDAVAWGVNQPRAVELCRGGRCANPAPGSVIARLPGAATALEIAAWAPLEPQLATPGGPNPRPPVSAFAVLPGTVYSGAPRFSWYGVPGAASYRLEVANDETFSSLSYEATVASIAGGSLEQLTARAPELPPGDYFWQVRAVGNAGEASARSRPVPFSVRSRGPAPHAARALPGGIDNSNAQSRGGGADGPPTGSAPARNAVCPGLAIPPGAGVCKELAVPVIRHQKDTKMLTLEAPNKEPPMGWDKPDVGGYPYCARAGVAMIHAYYRSQLGVPGGLSQDRIGYEVFKHLPETFIGTPWEGGPEYDLPVVGINDSSTSNFSLPLALGTRGKYETRPEPSRGDRNYCRERNLAMRCGQLGSPQCPQCPVEIEYRWGYETLLNIKTEIDAGRPLIATDPTHLYLIVGYVEKGDEFSIITQDEGGRTEVSLQQNSGEQARLENGNDIVAQLDGNEAVSLYLLLESYWRELLPVELGSDEPSVAKDDDGDGVVDFDEVERFGTDPHQPDSDGDGVNDKEEIHYSVWDPDHGYHRTVTSLSPNAGLPEVSARAENALREAMEIVKDNENGGCEDGEEDVNANGVRDPGETSNFLRDDDPLAEDGTCAALWTGTAEMRLWTRKPFERLDIHIVAELRLRETDLAPIGDPGPAYGGRNAGATVGSTAYLACQSMTLHETWRTELRSESGGEVQVMTAAGTKTIDTFDPKAGHVLRKSGELNLAPLLGFDIPQGGGLYSFLGCDFEFQNDLETVYTCSGSASCYEPFSLYMPFTSPYGIGRSPLQPPHPCTDPEIRHLEAGGQQMTGSYTFEVEEGLCVSTHGAVTWSLCKVGTPCSPLPPLPSPPPPPAPAQP